MHGMLSMWRTRVYARADGVVPTAAGVLGAMTLPARMAQRVQRMVATTSARARLDMQGKTVGGQLGATAIQTAEMVSAKRLVATTPVSV